MTGFSPMTAATEGLRVIRREPVALFGWIAIWALALVFVTVVQLLTVDHAVIQPPKPGVAGLIARFGPFAPVVITTVFTLIMMSSSTLFRAVLSPSEHGWHLFKLGAAEVRLAVITLAVTLVLVAFGGLPSLILLLFARPILAAVPGAGPWVVWIGTAATLAIDVWIGVRLSLAPVHTFAEGRFHILGYWRLTEGNFRRLLQSYLILALQIIAVVVVGFLGLFLIGQAATAVASGHLNFWSRSLLFGMVAAASVLLAILFVVPLTLVCACQALAYTAIVKPNSTSPWGASRRRAWPSRNPRVPSGEV